MVIEKRVNGWDVSVCKTGNVKLKQSGVGDRHLVSLFFTLV